MAGHAAHEAAKNIVRGGIDPSKAFADHESTTKHSFGRHGTLKSADTGALQSIFWGVFIPSKSLTSLQTVGQGSIDA